LVRAQFVSGTHALSSALFGILRPGDRWISIVGTPYDTMIPVIRGGEGWYGSLKEWGIEYDEIPLKEDASFDFEEIEKALRTKKTKMVYIQRSLGYTWRPSMNLEKMKVAIDFVKNIDSIFKFFSFKSYIPT
jgi:cystathionine beta-lyase family protein involved in aluminum resistance